MTSPLGKALGLAEEDAKDQPNFKTLTQPWRVLVVDDEPDIHSLTRLVLEDVSFKGRPLEILHANSAREAREMLSNNEAVALVLLDVVMETTDAGLRLVRFIREDLRDLAVQIVLRTGQAGSTPDHVVIFDYDINAFQSKTELTGEKLLTVVIAALRSYDSYVAAEQALRASMAIGCVSPNSAALEFAQATRDIEPTARLAEIETILYGEMKPALDRISLAVSSLSRVTRQIQSRIPFDYDIEDMLEASRKVDAAEIELRQSTERLGQLMLNPDSHESARSDPD